MINLNLRDHIAFARDKYSLIESPVDADSEYIYFIDLELSPNMLCKPLVKIILPSTRLSIEN